MKNVTFSDIEIRKNKFLALNVCFLVATRLHFIGNKLFEVVADLHIDTLKHIVQNLKILYRFNGKFL